MNGNFYDSEYYENGVISGKSLYSNYRWKENETTALMKNISKHLGIKEGMKVLDYGCAKGYLVYAFRQHGIDAFGVDISQYATSMCFDVISKNIKCIKSISDLPLDWGTFDYIIAKDVFEHIDVCDLIEILNELSLRAKKIFIVIPLGDGYIYLDPEQELDMSHLIKESLEWWKNTVSSNGWDILEAINHMPEVKPRYIHKPGSHAFITAVSKNLV